MQQLLRIERNTADLDRATAFYRDALGFRIDDVSSESPAWMRLPGIDITPSRCARLSLGEQRLDLTEFPDAAPYPADSTSSDLWFQHCAIVVDDMDAAHARVMQYGATPITRDGPQTLPPSTGSVTAFKFRDPDGHPLELIAFPCGVGDPVWQSARAQSSTLGIDHSAISVGDVARSITFHELLGLQMAARGVNRGAEQRLLDDLADAEVDVIAMQATASRTPHLELLGYRMPHARTVPPASLTAISADRLIWQATNLDMLLDAITDADFTDVILASGRAAGSSVAVLRDPDGHLSVLCESDSTRPAIDRSPR
ncbi:MAG: VOC family protein [Burkholderiales bacterium]